MTMPRSRREMGQSFAACVQINPSATWQPCDLGWLNFSVAQFPPKKSSETSNRGVGDVNTCKKLSRLAT